MSPELAKLADRLFNHEAEARPADCHPDDWNRIKVEMMIMTAMRHLHPEASPVCGTRAQAIRQALEPHGFGGEACLADLMAARRDELGGVRLLMSGTVYHHYQDDICRLGRKAARAEESDSGVHWCVLPGTTSEEAVTGFLARFMQPVRINSAHDCTGRYFADGVIVRRHAQRILITQSWGYDV